MSQTYIDIAAVDPATDVTVILNDADVTVTKETVDGIDVLEVTKLTNDDAYVFFDQFAGTETTDWEVWCALEVVQYTGGTPPNAAAGVAGNVIDTTNNYEARSREEFALVLSDRSDQNGFQFDTVGEQDVLRIGRIVGVRMRLEPNFRQRGKHWFESISGGESATLDTLVSNESAGWDGSRTPTVQLGAGQIGIAVRRGGTFRFYAVGIGTDGDPAPTEPVGVGAEEADVTTTQAAQLTSADTLVYRTLDASTLQALQTVSASVTGIFDASASTRQQQQRAEAAADVVAAITLDAVTRQAQQGTAASVLLRAKIDALTRQQPQLAQIAAEIVGIISAAAETRQQPQRATADLQSTISVSVGTQQQPQAAAATALVATILQTVTRQLPQRTTAAFGDLVRARIQATSIRRAIDLQTSITRP